MKITSLVNKNYLFKITTLGLNTSFYPIRKLVHNLLINFWTKLFQVSIIVFKLLRDFQRKHVPQKRSISNN